ncbi:sulfur carrier protein ThiS [Shewanella waksmanii]|uniref:sulfur carrier protein ThiS n=1 Tax=Shewanella waksmanii TaxID=213783 RepID=UPI003734FA7C
MNNQQTESLLTLLVNDIRHQVPSGTSLSQLLTILDVESNSVALVCNGQVVPKNLWQSTCCEDNAQIELFGAVAGG